jgi:hypothetical protein
MNLLSMDGDVGRRINAQLHAIATDVDDRYRDIRSDDNLFVELATKDQHVLSFVGEGSGLISCLPSWLSPPVTIFLLGVGAWLGTDQVALERLSSLCPLGTALSLFVTISNRGGVGCVPCLSILASG